MHRFLALFVLQSVLGNAFAFEPPQISIEEAFKKGKVAFVGRVVSEKIISAKEFEGSAEANVQILHCFYGTECAANSNVSVEYTLYTAKYGAMGIQFPLGYDVIFILSRSSTGDLSFDSDWEGGVDNAYVCSVLPGKLVGSTLDTPCFSIYDPLKTRKNWIKWDQLRELK